jgi:predicted enzyme related to lactoylglutathione lyase
MNTERNPVGWFEIYVQDMPRAKRFYERLFRVTLQRLESPDLEMWSFPMHPEGSGCTGALVKMVGKDSGIGGTIIYFVCDDCAQEAARAVAEGGQVQRAKMSIGQYGFIAFVLDTEGNMIGLHSMK